MSEVDYSRYPARETQLQWLHYYLRAQKGMAASPREVERLYVQVNKFALVGACLGGRRRVQGRPGAGARSRVPPNTKVPGSLLSRTKTSLGSLLPAELLPRKTPASCFINSLWTSSLSCV